MTSSDLLIEELRDRANRATASRAIVYRKAADHIASLERKIQAFRDDGLVQAAIARQGVLQAERDEAADRITSLEAALAEAHEALKPFAEAVAILDEDTHFAFRADDDMPIEYALYENQQPTVGDLRRAARASTSIVPLDGGEDAN